MSGSELVPDDWRELDDTLSDGPSPAEVPAAAKAWLAEQRFVHGLLRALHTADAAAREERIVRLTARIDAGSARGVRRHFALVGVAAALLASVVLWFALPDRLPTAEAAVERVARELLRDVDRRYRIEVETRVRGEVRADHTLQLVTRPGARFRLDGEFAFGGRQPSRLTIGSDGNEFWVQPASRAFRQTMPLSESSRLQELLDNVLDLVALDVHGLIARLPERFDVRVIGREAGADGRELLRIEATRPRGGFGGRLRSLRLLADERSGEIHRLDLRIVGLFGLERSVRLDYLGEVPAGLVDYGRPW
ncbi:MAG: hypothetical protein KDE27_14610 [Planctomycetes bacterium]|nr:hypothetical protein [Planctomycetota bacterium]